jgi:hypothetical protein
MITETPIYNIYGGVKFLNLPEIRLHSRKGDQVVHSMDMVI